MRLAAGMSGIKWLVRHHRVGHAGHWWLNFRFCSTSEPLVKTCQDQLRNIVASKKELATCPSVANKIKSWQNFPRKHQTGWGQIVEALMEQKQGGVTENYLYLDPKASSSVTQCVDARCKILCWNVSQCPLIFNIIEYRRFMSWMIHGWFITIWFKMWNFWRIPCNSAMLRLHQHVELMFRESGHHLKELWPSHGAWSAWSTWSTGLLLRCWNQNG